ncbi:MAG: metallophosphoesterase [Candidatus Pacearchaeota archaeon]|nr:metallophosphoesterase [Nanoarchaeota archaeon]MDZ4226579.1 metallophosphoesterase [Candidatus Pacearchaeota archaeon]
MNSESDLEEILFKQDKPFRGMRILAIGDPHGDLAKIKRIPIKGIDLILVTGDLGKADAARKRFFENIKRKKEGLPELKEDTKYLRGAHYEIHNSTLDILKYLSKFAPVYTIQGNVGIPTRSKVKEEEEKHGIILPATREKMKKMPDVYLVKNSLRLIDGLRIGFLEYYLDNSWVKEFNQNRYKKKAKKQTERARRVLSRFSDLDIFICHQPPYGFLDKVSGKYGAPKDWQGKHAGGKAILDYIKRHQPPYVLCGHIHEGEGKARIGKSQVYNLGVAGHVVLNLHQNP